MGRQMAWIDEAYAEEVAVLTTWLAAFLPWTVAYTGEAFQGSRIFFFRFPAFGLQLRFPVEVTADGRVLETNIPQRLAEQYGGFGVAGNLHLELAPLQVGTVDGAAATAYLLWTAATVVMVAAVVLSLAMYFREDFVRTRLPMGYPTLASVTFGVLTVLLAGATVAYYLSDIEYGTPIPLGVGILAAFAVVLWRAEEGPAGEPTADAE